MSSYRITMQRTAGLSEAEIARRLALVYDLLLQLADEPETAPTGEVDGQAADAVGDVLAQDQDNRGDYSMIGRESKPPAGL